MKKLLLAILCISIAGASTADDNVSLPKDHREKFVEYLSLDRVQNHDQFIRLFANEAAMQGKNEQGELKNGSVLVAEVYSVQKNKDGTVKNSMLGRRVKDRLLLLAVMEKKDGFGKRSSSPINTGDWNFAAYKPNGEVAPKNLDVCRACHSPLTGTDFVFSIEHLPKSG